MYLAIIFGMIITAWMLLNILGYIRAEYKHNWIDSITACGVFFGIFIIIITIANFATDSSQLSDFEKLRTIDKQIELYQEKTEELTCTFTTLLAEQYPNHEKGIFKTISPEKIDLYFVKYPEIKSAQTFVDLANKIKEMNDELYSFRIKRTTISNKIRFNLVNPWVFKSFISKPDKDLAKTIY